MLERILLPIAPYLFMVIGFSLCVYLFVTLKREISLLGMRLGKRDASIEEAQQTVLARVEEFRRELQCAEQRTAQLVPPPPLRSGLNLNKRTQVIRMFRHGEAEAIIASKLGLPRNEVNLLLKVHKLAVNGPAILDSPDAAPGASAP